MRDGKPATVDEVMAEIEKCRAFITTAGGGVALTGGEVLLQPVFTAAVFRRCKELGLHTALDTSGFLGARAMDEFLADTDLVLLDVKSFDATTYRKLTCGELAPTLDFATRLDRLGKRMWIRCVPVPGWTDAPEAIDGLADFLAGLPSPSRSSAAPVVFSQGRSVPAGDQRPLSRQRAERDAEFRPPDTGGHHGSHDRRRDPRLPRRLPPRRRRTRLTRSPRKRNEGSMKAAVVREFGKPLVIEERPGPEPGIGQADPGAPLRGAPGRKAV